MALLVAFAFFNLMLLCSSSPAPLNCSDVGRVCTSFLAFKTGPSTTLPLLQSMFDVFPEDITADEAGNPGYVFVRKNCSCLSVKEYLSTTTFTLRQEESSVYPAVAAAYEGLAYLPNTTATRAAREGAVVSLQLLCGCSSGLWNYLMSYVMEEGDTIESLSSRFGVSMDSIETANGMSGPEGIVVGDVYYIPLNSVPGNSYSVNEEVSPATAPAPVPNWFTSSVRKEGH